jgi:hypothetical protein
VPSLLSFLFQTWDATSKKFFVQRPTRSRSWCSRPRSQRMSAPSAKSSCKMYDFITKVCFLNRALEFRQIASPPLWNLEAASLSWRADASRFFPQPRNKISISPLSKIPQSFKIISTRSDRTPNNEYLLVCLTKNGFKNLSREKNLQEWRTKEGEERSRVWVSRGSSG